MKLFLGDLIVFIFSSLLFVAMDKAGLSPASKVLPALAVIFSFIGIPVTLIIWIAEATI